MINILIISSGSIDGRLAAEAAELARPSVVTPRISPPATLTSRHRC
jgi:hypothetical protein